MTDAEWDAATPEQRAARVQKLLDAQDRVSNGILREVARLLEFVSAHPRSVVGFDSYTTGLEHVATVRFDRAAYLEWRNASTTSPA